MRDVVVPSRSPGSMKPTRYIMLVALLLVGRRPCDGARVHEQGHHRRPPVGAGDAGRGQGRGRLPRDQGGGRHQRPAGRGEEPGGRRGGAAQSHHGEGHRPHAPRRCHRRAGGQVGRPQAGRLSPDAHRPQGAAEGGRSPQADPGVREGGRDRGGGDGGAAGRHGPARLRPPAGRACSDRRRTSIEAAGQAPVVTPTGRPRATPHRRRCRPCGPRGGWRPSR